MKKLTTVGAALGLLALGASAFAQFTGGNLVVSVVKSANGTAPGSPSNVGQRHVLREYTILGVPSGSADVNIYGLASEVASTSNRRAVLSGSASSEGFISLTPDSRYLIFTGYDADIGTPTIAATESAATPRVIGRYEWAQAPSATTLVTSAFITDAFSAGNIRSAVSLNGSQFWATGSNNGIRYTDSTLTAGTTVQVSGSQANGGTPNPVVNWRVTNIFDGQLYATAASGGAVGLNTIGTGTPSAASQTVTRLFDATIGGSKSASSYDFVFESANVVYVADDTTNNAPIPATANGGLQRWANGDTGWINTNTVVIPAAANAANRAGLRGVTRGAGNLYYATTTDRRLISIDVTNINTPIITTLATAPVDEEWRDVQILPIIQTSFTVSGTVQFQAGMENVPLNQSLFLTFTPTVGAPINQTVTPNANGSYTSQPVPPGIYRLRAKTTFTLSEASDVTVTISNVTGQNFTFRGGDVNSDNAVDIGDLSPLISAYNQISPAAGYNPAADINNDGANDIADLLIIIGNYNQLGEN